VHADLNRDLSDLTEAAMAGTAAGQRCLRREARPRGASVLKPGWWSTTAATAAWPLRACGGCCA
jgi:hypothetical protein